MKTPFKLLASTAAAALLLTSPVLQAESTYGYSPSGATGVLATANVKVSVTVPTLILLRVGPAGSDVSELEFAPVPSVNSAPGSSVLAALTTDTNSGAATWAGTTPAAPTFAAPSTQSLTATVWTNSAGGGQMGLETTVDTALGGLSPAAITVTPTAGVGSMPAHPGTTATNANIGTFSRNTIHSATWAYSVDGTALGSASAGNYVQTTTYTATAL